MKERRLLFSVTSKDFDVQTFCTGGNGGQHRNAKRNGVRIIHRESGARAEHRDGRDQGKNRKAAFEKLLLTPEWKAWHQIKVARSIGLLDIVERYVEDTVKPDNLRVEVKDAKGSWYEVDRIDGGLA